MDDEVMDGGAEDDILDRRQAIKAVVDQHTRGTSDSDVAYDGAVVVWASSVDEFIDEICKAAGLE